MAIECVAVFLRFTQLNLLAFRVLSSHTSRMISAAALAGSVCTYIRVAKFSKTYNFNWKYICVRCANLSLGNVTNTGINLYQIRTTKVKSKCAKIMNKASTHAPTINEYISSKIEKKHCKHTTILRIALLLWSVYRKIIESKCVHNAILCCFFLFCSSSSSCSPSPSSSSYFCDV